MVMGGKSQVLCYTMNDISQKKAQYRQQARIHRDQTPPDPAVSEAIIEPFLDEIKPEKHQKIALYWPTDKELDCRFLADELCKRGFTVLLPKVIADTKILSFAPWTPDTEMIEGEFGILEPENNDDMTPDIVLAPLLAFDQKGTRLGQGGGYYDATIADLRKNGAVLYAGLGYGAQAVLFNLPKEEHDQALDCIITPEKVIRF